MELEQSTKMLNLFSRLLFTYPDGSLMDHLEVLSQSIIGLIRIIQPKIIFVPDRNDMHPDHRAVSYSLIHAYLQMESKIRDKIIIFEYLINGKFKPDFLIDTTKTNELKSSLLKLFASQKRLQNVCTKAALIREAKFGKKINRSFAEGFRLVNYIRTTLQYKELILKLKFLGAIDINNNFHA